MVGCMTGSPVGEGARFRVKALVQGRWGIPDRL
jgi:hypothetical protein